MSLFNSKYPEIVIDTTNQMPNPHMKKTLTIEEYYDLFHHTHVDVGNGGPMVTPSQIEAISTLSSRVDALEATVSKMAKVIQQLAANNGDINNDDLNFDFDGLYISVDDNSSDDNTSTDIEDAGNNTGNTNTSSSNDNNDTSSSSSNTDNNNDSENIGDLGLDIDDGSTTNINTDNNQNNDNHDNDIIDPGYIEDGDMD